MHYLFLRHVVSHFQAHSNRNSELGTRDLSCENGRWLGRFLRCLCIFPSHLHSKTILSPTKHVWTWVPLDFLAGDGSSLDQMERTLFDRELCRKRSTLLQNGLLKFQLLLKVNDPIYRLSSNL